MQAKTIRHIHSGKEFDKFFPEAKATEKTILRSASVDDTVKFIPEVVKETKWHTKNIAQMLKAESVHATCRNIWNFVYKHIRYNKDDDGLEQIRSPARTWHDRFRGVDCDCYTTFISSILTNLKIPHVLRITKYRKDYFQHIYPIVPTGNGSYITMDCVIDQFNKEEPYKEKQDTKMDLQYLEGIEDRELSDLGSFSEYEGLGKRGWFKRFLHNAIHNFNRFNPATLALRNGVLAAMKLNLFKVPQRLKYAYLSEAEAKKRGLIMDRWYKLVKVKDKLENIFFGAGGKPKNLKKALLTGKGNHNHDVNGLGYVMDEGVMGMDETTPLRQLLGEEIWHSENEGAHGVGELGDPVTGGTVAVASGILAIISGIIKGIGTIFPKKDAQGAEDFQNTQQADAQASEQASTASPSDQKIVASAPDDAAPGSTSSSPDGGDNGSGSNATGFWDKNKKWLKPTLFGVGGLGLLYGGYKLVASDKKEKKKESKPKEPVEGVNGKKKKIEPVAYL
jgi:hypothetical protein